MMCLSMPQQSLRKQATLAAIVGSWELARLVQSGGVAQPHPPVEVGAHAGLVILHHKVVLQLLLALHCLLLLCHWRLLLGLVLLHTVTLAAAKQTRQLVILLLAMARDEGGHAKRCTGLVFRLGTTTQWLSCTDWQWASVSCYTKKAWKKRMATGVGLFAGWLLNIPIKC